MILSLMDKEGTIMDMLVADGAILFCGDGHITLIDKEKNSADPDLTGIEHIFFHDEEGEKDE